MVTGQFASTADVSGVATGSMLLSTVTMIITGLSMGITIVVGEEIGKRKPREAGAAIGTGICLFLVFAGIVTVILAIGAPGLAQVMHAPEAAFLQTTTYIRICGIGSLFIVSYNVLGAIFRGIGDSKTPLITVMIACVINVIGDLILVAVFHMGAAGAAIATVAAQCISVLVSLLIIRRKTLPFEFHRSDLRFRSRLIKKELKVGIPVALQEFLVGTSFLVIQTIVNSFGVSASAGIGIAEKICTFIMLIPSSYMQSMSAFVAQNMGAGNKKRAKGALVCGVITAFSVGVVMGILTFFHGDFMAAIFSGKKDVIDAAYLYLKAYAIDCALTPFLFCFVGYFNGCEKTILVMIQGIVGAFCVRIPVAYAVSKMTGTTLFEIGLATPLSSTIQIAICLGDFLWFEKQEKKSQLCQNGK